MKRRHLAALALAIGLAGAAQAQDAPALPAACLPAHEAGAAHGGHAAADPAPADAHAALAAGMDAMHRDMAVGMTAEDIDVAFVCGMIPHHQGAIDMARAVLAHGDDPWVRALAEQIVAAQEQEIADMQAWLAQRGH